MSQPPDGEPNGDGPVHGRTPTEDPKLRALQRAVDDLAAGRLDPADVMRRFSRLGQLLTSLPELSAIRPDREAFEHALGELPDKDRMAALGVDANLEHTRKARSAFFPKVFDARFLHELEQGLAAATASVEARADLDALGAGLYCVTVAQNGSLAPEHNPLFELLANLVRVETIQLAQTFSELGLLRPEGEETPEETAGREARFREAVQTNPVVRAEFERIMRQQSSRLLAAIADASIRPCLTRDELAPILEGLEALAAQDAEAGHAHGSSRDSVAALFQRFIDDPASGAAFARFEADFAAQVKESIAAGRPDAEFLMELQDLWERLSETGGMARLLLCHGSFTRLLQSGQLKQ